MCYLDHYNYLRLKCHLVKIKPSYVTYLLLQNVTPLLTLKN